MICSYCSAEMPEISAFCPACGRSVDRAESEDPISAARVRDSLLGMLAYVGGRKALADLPAVKWSGFLTWIFWRSAYLSRLVSVKNKVLVVFDWLKSQFFGRDISHF